MGIKESEGVKRKDEKEVEYIEHSTPNQHRLRIGEDWGVYTPQEVMKILYASRNTVYNLLKTGELKSFKVGTQYRIYRRDLEDYIARTTI